MKKSLKKEAEEITAALDHEVEELAKKEAPEVEASVQQTRTILERLLEVLNNIDIAVVEAYVRAMQDKYPDDSTEKFVQRLIRLKCQKTAAVGAVTSSASLVPGLGTATAVTVGLLADISATFKLQAELVLEIAIVHDYPLTDAEKYQLVMLITGLSAGTASLSETAGQDLSMRITEQLAGQSVLKAIPVIGMMTSAGTNSLTTYTVGQRADAYFGRGPEAMGSWTESLRAISGVDERRLVAWLAEAGTLGKTTLTSGLNSLGKSLRSGADSLWNLPKSSYQHVRGVFAPSEKTDDDSK